MAVLLFAAQLAAALHLGSAAITQSQMQHARQANLKQYAVLKDITARQALRTASAANLQMIRLCAMTQFSAQSAVVTNALVERAYLGLVKARAFAANPQIRLYVKGRMDSQNAAQLTAPQLRGVEKSAAFQSKCALMGLAAIMAKNV
jgi:hypothetical protein